jgi:hypothetical protein
VAIATIRASVAFGPHPSLAKTERSAGPAIGTNATDHVCKGSKADIDLRRLDVG